MTDLIATLDSMLARGNDSPMLRFGLGKAYLDAGREQEAVPHLQRAVEQQPDYSAAWKLLGKALARSGADEAATAAFRRGIEVAEVKGDVQAAREMKVFLKRLAPKA